VLVSAVETAKTTGPTQLGDLYGTRLVASAALLPFVEAHHWGLHLRILLFVPLQDSVAHPVSQNVSPWNRNQVQTHEDFFICYIRRKGCFSSLY
jgi:hypothetical protein